MIDQTTLFFPDKPRWRWFILGILFITAVGIRVYGVFDLPFDFHPTRQYRSALIARAYYYKMEATVPEWQQQVAYKNAEREGILEPPILEFVTAIAYRLVGGEHLWIPRLLSSLFWVIGGFILYVIGMKIGNADMAIISTAFYLLLPFGVTASRSFQPDPMMILIFLVSILTILQYYERPDQQRLLITALTSAIAILIKPICLFTIFGVFFALAISTERIRKWNKSLDLLVYVVVSLLPSALFYFYGIFLAGFLREQAQASFLPELVLQFRFWDGWLKRIRSVMGFTALIGGLIGVILFQSKRSRSLLMGLWFGYFSFNFAFTYHIHTHDYYHLQLIPIVALSLGSIASLILDRLHTAGTSRYLQTAIWCIICISFFLSAGTSIQYQRKLANAKNEVELGQVIGKAVAHSTRTIILAADYGKPLEYYGEFSGDYWPYRYDIRDSELWDTQVLDVEARFRMMNPGNSLEYFIVADHDEFDAQNDLKEFLLKNFSVLEQSDTYIIFDLRQH